MQRWSVRIARGLLPAIAAVLRAIAGALGRRILGMTLAMQDRLIAPGVVDIDAGQFLCRRPMRHRDRLPRSKTHPGALLLAGVPDVEQPGRLTILLALILDLRNHRHRVR